MQQKYNKKLKKVIVSFKYLALSCDEVITIDNQSWVFIHCYVVQDWCYLFLLIFKEQVTKGKGLNNLIKILMDVLEKHGDVSNVGATTKLMSFNVDGVNVFQGVCKVILIKFKISLPLFGRYPWHGTSHYLAMQTSSHVPIIKCIVQSLYFNPFTHFFVISQDFAFYIFISPSFFFYLHPLFFFFLLYFYTFIPLGWTL